MKRVNGGRSRSPRTWFTLARILAILVLVTLPLVNNATVAKYVAEATVEAGARVAKWEVVLDAEDVPVLPLDLTGIIPPINGTGPGHKLLVFFKGLTGSGTPVGTPVTGDAAFSVDFINKSEVAALFIPKIEVDMPVDPGRLTIVKNSIKFYDAVNDPTHLVDITTSGIELAPDESRLVDVVIHQCTFSGLVIGAYCEQVD